MHLGVAGNYHLQIEQYLPRGEQLISGHIEDHP